MEKCILIVDDSAEWRARMREVVAPLGYEIIEADGYHAARALIKEHERELALIVCDNSMPIAGRIFPNLGLELRADMHMKSAVQAAIPFILFTSEVSEQQKERAHNIGAVAVQKRFNQGGELEAVVKRLLERPA